MDVVERMRRPGMVGILRIADPDRAVRPGAALIEAGCDVIEANARLAFGHPAALVGAGTVLRSGGHGGRSGPGRASS